jgi:hypothetical protein
MDMQMDMQMLYARAAYIVCWSTYKRFSEVLIG